MRLINWFKKKEVVQIQEPTIKTVNISSKYLKNRLPDIEELNLKARRERLGLTLREVESLCKVATTTINRIENNRLEDYYYRSIQQLHNFYLQEESKIK